MSKNGVEDELRRCRINPNSRRQKEDKAVDARPALERFLSLLPTSNLLELRKWKIRDYNSVCMAKLQISCDRRLKGAFIGKEFCCTNQITKEYGVPRPNPQKRSVFVCLRL
jgi:hypothetical protein